VAAELRANFSIRLSEFTLAPEFSLAAEMGVIFGPSGAGKSLTLQAIAGLVRPENGRIHLNGRELFNHETGIDLPPQNRQVGYVPQSYALFPHRTVAENIGYGLHELSAAAKSDQVRQLLSLMRLEQFASRKPSEISGGQQQRTALARALAPRPGLLLMDEPFAAVEEDLRTHLKSELVRVQQEFGIPVLLVTHNLPDAYSLAEKLIVVAEGTVIQAGSRDRIFRQPNTPEVARLIGMANVIEVKPVTVERDQLTAQWGDSRLRIAIVAGQDFENSLLVGVRPEEVRIQGTTEQQEADNLLQGVITGDAPQGADHLLAVELEGETLSVRVPHPEFVELGIAVGQIRGLVIRPDAFHLFVD
jgi:molybdate transport system ATP-binding protein